MYFCQNVENVIQFKINCHRDKWSIPPSSMLGVPTQQSVYLRYHRPFRRPPPPICCWRWCCSPRRPSCPSRHRSPSPRRRCGDYLSHFPPRRRLLLHLSHDCAGLPHRCVIWDPACNHWLSVRCCGAIWLHLLCDFLRKIKYICHIFWPCATKNCMTRFVHCDEKRI